MFRSETCGHTEWCTTEALKILGVGVDMCFSKLGNKSDGNLASIRHSEHARKMLDGPNGPRHYLMGKTVNKPFTKILHI